jgi:hypothetical protein
MVAMLGLAFVLELIFKLGLLSFRSLPLATFAAIRRASSLVAASWQHLASATRRTPLLGH